MRDGQNLSAVRNSAFYAEQIAAKYKALDTQTKAVARQLVMDNSSLDPSLSQLLLARASRDQLEGALLTLLTVFDEGSGPGATNIFNAITIPFAYNTPSPLTLDTLVAGDIVDSVAVRIDVPFNDAAATLQVGIPQYHNLKRQFF